MLVLSELKTQALRYMVLGDLARAFRTYEAIVARRCRRTSTRA